MDSQKSQLDGSSCPVVSCNTSFASLSAAGVGAHLRSSHSKQEFDQALIDKCARASSTPTQKIWRCPACNEYFGGGSINSHKKSAKCKRLPKPSSQSVIPQPEPSQPAPLTTMLTSRHIMAPHP